MRTDNRDTQEWPDAAARAAEELAVRLEALADTLAAQRKPTSIPYGTSRLGAWFRHQSPAGFVIDPGKRQLLLPDGRLWSYNSNDAGRFPAGRLYEARADYLEFASSRIFPGGTEFVFLGAVLGGYTFGCAEHAAIRPDSASGLCAISGAGRSVRYTAPGPAFAAIAESVAGAPPTGSVTGRGRSTLRTNRSA